MKNFLLLALILLNAQLSLAQNTRSSAEVFLLIEDRGNFTVSLNDEFIGSTKQKFRFYDVYNTTALLSISQGNQKILNKQIQIKPNERLILNFSLRQGLRTIKALPMYRNGDYVLNDFDNYYSNTPEQNNNSYQFDTFLAQVKREAFDDNKIKLIQAQSPYLRLTTAQTATLLKTFFKDENKLITVKSLMRSIVDPQNIYLLNDAFTFSSGKEEFLSFLRGYGTTNTRGWSKRDFEQLLSSVKREAFDSNRTKLIQAAMVYGSPSTAQVGELLKTFSSDDNALNTAKMLYPVVADPHRYFTLKDIFKFLSSREAFIDFLAGR